MDRAGKLLARGELLASEAKIWEAKGGFLGTAPGIDRRYGAIAQGLIAPGAGRSSGAGGAKTAM